MDTHFADSYLRHWAFISWYERKCIIKITITWWRHQMETFSRYWSFARGIHRSPVNSPHKGQWHGALMFSLIRARINGWVNNGEAGDLRRHRSHYDVSVDEWSSSSNPHELKFVYKLVLTAFYEIDPGWKGFIFFSKIHCRVIRKLQKWYPINVFISTIGKIFYQEFISSLTHTALPNGIMRMRIIQRW